MHKDGKLRKRFESLYDEIYTAGYYKGLKATKRTINADFENTKEFLQKLEIKVED